MKTLFILLFAMNAFGQYNSTHTGAEIDAGIRPYKVYAAMLNQSGTAAPTAVVYENTLGTVVWTRVGSGVYEGTLAGAFPSDKTIVIIENQYEWNGEGIGFTSSFQDESSPPDNVRIIHKTNLGSNADYMYGAYIEIRVYP